MILFQFLKYDFISCIFHHITLHFFGSYFWFYVSVVKLRMTPSINTRLRTLCSPSFQSLLLPPTAPRPSGYNIQRCWSRCCLSVSSCSRLADTSHLSCCGLPCCLTPTHILLHFNIISASWFDFIVLKQIQR